MDHKNIMSEIEKIIKTIGSWANSFKSSNTFHIPIESVTSIYEKLLKINEILSAQTTADGVLASECETFYGFVPLSKINSHWNDNLVFLEGDECTVNGKVTLFYPAGCGCCPDDEVTCDVTKCYACRYKALNAMQLAEEESLAEKQRIEKEQLERERSKTLFPLDNKGEL